MLSLGPYKFTPISLKYSKENRWSVIECIDKMPSLQNIGRGVENVDIEGVIYLNILNRVNQLKNMKEAEKPHVLVDSLGNILGQFVITRLEEKQMYFLPCDLHPYQCYATKPPELAFSMSSETLFAISVFFLLISCSASSPSHWNGEIDWLKVAKDEVRFAFAKATEGETFQDTKFGQNFQSMKDNNVREGSNR